MNRYRTFFKVLLVVAVSLTLTALLSSTAAAETDDFMGVAFHPFTLDYGNDNSTCISFNDTDIGPVQNCDPVNLIFPGRTWTEVSNMLQAADWSVTGAGSDQELHYDDGAGPYLQDQQLITPDTPFGPRYHIRLWQAPGTTLVTFGAVHHEDFLHRIDMSWEEAEFHVASALCGASCEQAELPTQIEIQGGGGQWRSEDNNGWATVIPAPGAPDDPPSVTIISPTSGSTVSGMTPVAIQASDDVEPVGGLTVEWRADGGNWLPAVYDAGSGYYEATWDAAALADGDYLFEARATDSVPNSTATSHTVTVDNPNAPPTASFTFSCADLDCDFDASASNDPDGGIAGYTWDFGDDNGDSGSAPTTSHTYATAGTYNVILTVTDNEGAPGMDSQNVTVDEANYLPIVIFSISCSELSCSFDGSASYDPDGTIVDYNWDFGDGNGSSGSAATAGRTYDTAGTYNVSLTVTDNEGGMATDSQSVSVAGAPASTMHVGDLEGLSIAKKNWQAEVTITVHNDGEGLVSGATVSGEWSGDTSGTTSCMTDSSGTCTVITAELPKKTTQQVVFTVTGVDHATLNYEAAGNHDPQGNSSGTAIQVEQGGGAQDPGGTPGQLSLSAVGYKVKGIQQADLNWSGATSAEVDIFRNGSWLVTLSSGNTPHTDVIGLKGGGSYLYQVCEAGTAVCSDVVAVEF